jgi:oxygen-independent coproporphyrinogen-3 oxidase
MVKLILVPDHPILKFDRQLPFFNWYYPFERDSDRVPDRAAPLLGFAPRRHARTAVYIHIPFCQTICSFCPFSRGRYHSSVEVDRYVSALVAEIALKRQVIGRYAPMAIFVGGGTPSILEPVHIEALGRAIHESFDLRSLEEFTFELEAKSVSADKLAAMRDIGVNRVSFGVQTFSERHRALFALDATVAQVRKAAELANATFAYTNADMIYGAPDQTLEELRRDAGEARSLGTTTIDFYPLNNLAAQLRMHREAEAQGFPTLPATTRLRYRLHLDEVMRAHAYAPISGYGYALARHVDRPTVVQHAPKFLYHDIVYGYHDDLVMGYGAAALTQIPGFNLYNFADRGDYAAEVSAGRLPHDAFAVGDSFEKGLVSFPYRGVLDKSRIPWASLPVETTSALARACDASLVQDLGETLAVTAAGWLYYVNLMYYLMPAPGKNWISARIATRMRQGRTCEETDLSDFHPIVSPA